MLQNQIKDVYLLFDFEACDDFLPNGLNHNHTDSVFEKHGFIDNEVMDYYYKNHVQIPVLKELLNIEDNILHHKSISKYEELEEDKNNVFLYPIEPFANLDHALGNEYSYEKKSILHFVSDKAIKYAKQPDNKFYLLINFCNEGTLRSYTFQQLHDMVDEFKIPRHKLIFVIAAADVSDLYEKWCNENNIKEDNRIKTIYRTWSITNKVKEAIKIIYPKSDERQINIDQEYSTVVNYEDISKENIRNHKFINLNRRMRDHRVMLISLLGENFIKQNLVSYDWENVTDEAEVEFFESRVGEELWDIGLKNMKNLKLNFPKSFVDYENIMSTIGFGCENKEPYLDSYINITSETNFYDAGVYFSEKTWKPIINLQPFISVNYHNSLKYLKELGLKTFHPFIDETYDTIENPQERMSAIYNEIMRLNSKPIEEIHEWYHSIFDILKHNRETLLSYYGKKMVKEDMKYIYKMKSYIEEQILIQKNLI
jgi:hypothetical protein